MHTIRVFIPLGWFAGGDRHAVEVARHWHEYGYSVTVLLPRFLYLILSKDKRFQQSHFSYYPIDCPPPRGKYVSDLLRYSIYVFRGLLRIKRIGEFDLIYCPGHDLEILIMAVIAKRRNSNIKLCAWIHHLAPSLKTMFQSRRGNFLERILMVLSYFFEKVSVWLISKRADVIFTPTHLTQKEIIRRGIHSRVQQINNGIDLEYIASVPVRGKEWDICSIGVSPQKGTLDLINAWAMVAMKMKNSKLVLIGHLGGWETSFRNFVHRLNLDKNMILTGSVEEDEKFTWLKSCKVFVCSSREEGWSISISEAAACGLPIIAYDNPIFREVYADAILYVPRGNIKELANVIFSILSNPKLAEEYSERSIKWSMKHEWKEVARKEVSLFSSILELEK